MRIRHLACIAVILLSGCTLQDAYVECKHEGQSVCVMDYERGRVVLQTCLDSKYNFSECPLGCDFEEGVCVSQENSCTPEEHTVICANPSSQLRCVELEGQTPEDSTETVAKKYVKRVVPCPDDGVCNSRTRECDSKSEVNEECHNKPDYCEEGTKTISHYCSNGVFYRHDCAIEGLVCMNGRCVEEPVCDPVTFKTDCAGPDALTICNEYGQYDVTPCSDMTECFNGACMTKFHAGDPCDSGSFVNYCSDDGLYQCLNNVVVVTNCSDEGDGYICEDPEFMDYAAGCYPECETLGMISGRQSCMRADNRLSYDACVKTSSERNVMVSQLVTNACFGDSFTSCKDGGISMVHCPGGCVISASMGYNVHCDLNAPTGNCQADSKFSCKDLKTQVICDPQSLIPKEVPCGESERCSEGKCVAHDAPAVVGEFCDPADTLSKCLDERVLIRCNAELGMYEYIDCSDYIFDNQMSSGETPEVGVCREVWVDGLDVTEGTCGFQCGGSSCLQDSIHDNSCQNGKFIHLTKVEDSQGSAINRITEVISHCHNHRMIYCSGNEMKNAACTQSCVSTSPVTAECR